MDAKELGRRIKTRREVLGITETDLARSIDLNETAVRQIESGQMIFDITVNSYLRQIAEALATTPKDLRNEEPSSERATREELQRMLSEGLLEGEAELREMQELATAEIRKRSMANLPLHRDQLLIIRDVKRLGG